MNRTRIERIGLKQPDFSQEKSYLFNKPGEKPSFSSSCKVPDLGGQKLGFFRPEILSRYEKSVKIRPICSIRVHWNPA
jgi:hypothetical protein